MSSNSKSLEYSNSSDFSDETYIPSPIEESEDESFENVSDKNNEEESEKYVENEYEKENEDIDEKELKVLKKLKIKNPLLHNNFIEVRKYLLNEYPNIKTILETPMLLKDRAYLLELYEIFEECNSPSYDFLDLKTDINNFFKNSVKRYKIEQSMDKNLQQEIKKQISILETIYIENLEHKIALLDLPLESKSIIYNRYKIMIDMDTSSEEYGKIYEWITTILKIPFTRTISLSLPNELILKRLLTQLDAQFTGLENVKEQILLYINDKLLNSSQYNYALGLVSDVGQGKTSISLAIAKALDYPFYKLSGGCLSSINAIHGHNFTYIGSQPGALVKALIQMKYKNGIILIDEFDKINLETSLSSVLQLIDPVQNDSFNDYYVGENIPIDLSKIIFILSMNKLPDNKILSDRIFPVFIEEYTFKQKIEILKTHTLPNLNTRVKIADDILQYIVQQSTNNGMRQCIKTLTDLVSKLNFIIDYPSIKHTFYVDILNKNIVCLTDIKHILYKSEKNININNMYM
jgi:ATP-dependent Lon protease